MKKSLLCFFICISWLGAWEMPLANARLRNCKGEWKAPLVSAVNPGRSAELYFSFDRKIDLSRFNRIRFELTPLEGKFVKRNLILSFFSGREIFRSRPENAPGGALLELNKKITLDYIIKGNLKDVDAVRLFFNRKTDDRSNQKFLLHKIDFTCKFTPRKSHQFRYKVNTPTCALLAADDRGLTPQEAKFTRPKKKRKKKRIYQPPQNHIKM